MGEAIRLWRYVIGTKCGVHQNGPWHDEAKEPVDPDDEYCVERVLAYPAATAAAMEACVEALKWYASRGAYAQDHDDGCHPEGGCVGTCGLRDIDRDEGAKARAALASLSGRAT